MIYHVYMKSDITGEMVDTGETVECLDNDDAAACHQAKEAEHGCMCLLVAASE